jgi:hypothetical protein
MASFFTKAKNASIKTKVKTEIALLDRDIKNRQKKFGVEVYDLLVAAALDESGEKEFTNNAEANKFLESCRSDVQNLLNQQVEKKQAQEDITNREAPAPSVTTSEKLAKVGKGMSDAGTKAKLSVEAKLLDGKVKTRKETFGVEVLDLLTDAEEQGEKIQGCIDSAKTDVAYIRGKKEKKEQEIVELDAASK